MNLLVYRMSVFSVSGFEASETSGESSGAHCSE